MDRTEVRRIDRRIAKAWRRIGRGVDVRNEVLRGEVSETQIAMGLAAKLQTNGEGRSS